MEVIWIAVVGYFLYKAYRDRWFRPMYLLLGGTGLCNAFAEYAEKIGMDGTATELAWVLSTLSWIAAMTFWYLKQKKLGNRIRPFILWLMAALACISLLSLFVYFV